jgi:CheY-like chemotaxis protein
MDLNSISFTSLKNDEHFPLKQCSLVPLGGNMRDRFILVADSSDEFVESLRNVLPNTEYILLQAKDGREAIEYFERLKQIDLAIIELELSVVNGFDVIGRLTKKRSKATKIIATTTRFNGSSLERVKELGVDAMVCKPIPHEEWRTTLETVMAGG